MARLREMLNASQRLPHLHHRQQTVPLILPLPLVRTATRTTTYAYARGKTHPDQQWAISIIKILTTPFTRPRGSSDGRNSGLPELDDAGPDTNTGEDSEEVIGVYLFQCRS